jgi:hypothetical protein
LNARQFGRAFRNWSESQLAIDGLVSRSRRGVSWARPLAANEVEWAEQLASTDSQTVRQHYYWAVANRGDDRRYRSLNVGAYPLQGTLEIRQHQGTTNSRKILAWIEMGQAFFAAAKAMDTVAALTPDDLVEALSARGLPAATATYLRERAAQFARADGRQASQPMAPREPDGYSRDCRCGECVDYRRALDDHEARVSAAAR